MKYEGTLQAVKKQDAFVSLLKANRPMLIREYKETCGYVSR